MATKTYKISRKQTLQDACVQVYGTVQLLFKFAKDNGLSIDSVVDIGTSLSYNDALGNEDLKFKITERGLLVNNPEPSISNWILATGFWRDTGEWIDTEIWND